MNKLKALCGLIKISSKAVLIRIHVGHANEQIHEKFAVAVLKKMVINVRPLKKESFFARSLYLVWTEDAELYISACRFS